MQQLSSESRSVWMKAAAAVDIELVKWPLGAGISAVCQVACGSRYARGV